MNYRRMLTFVAVVALVPVGLTTLTGCPKKEAPPPPVPEAAPPPASTPEVTELAPLADEGGADAEAGAPKKWTGPGMSANQVKIKACCNAMRTQAKAMGSSPEAFQVNSAATMCDTMAAQVGASGTAPEFAQIRAVLKSIQLPAACSF
ncbi:MAG: hypothetical protein ACRENE_16675 [Polyangiaceae bacterium]